MNENDPIKNPTDPVNPQNDNPPADDLAEYKNAEGQFDADKIRKLAEDKKYFRSQISKLRQVPQKVEEYSKDFALDSKFDEFITNEENKKKIDTVFEKLDKLSLEKGIGVERNHDIRRFVLDQLVESKAIDLTTEAERTAADQKAIAERNAKVQEVIGEVSDINAWNEALFGWLKDFCNSEAEFQMHKKLVERNSVWALSLNKVRHAMMGNRIPVAVSEPKYNEAEWNRAFVKASREEQDKMLEERAKMMIKNRK